MQQHHIGNKLEGSHEYPELTRKFLKFTPNDHARILSRLSIQKQISHLLKHFGHLRLQTEKQVFSQPLIQARRRTATQLVIDSYAAGRPIKDILQVHHNRTLDVLRYWSELGMKPSTLRTRIAHINWLLAALHRTKFLSAAHVFEVLNLDLESSSNSDLKGAPTEAEVQRGLIVATEKDRFVGMQLKLIYYVGLTPAEAISFRPMRSLAGNCLTLTGEGTPKTIKFIGPLNAMQVALVQEACELAWPFKVDRIRLPEMSFHKARERLYYIARLSGFGIQGLRVTPAKLADLRKLHLNS